MTFKKLSVYWLMSMDNVCIPSICGIYWSVKTIYVTKFQVSETNLYCRTSGLFAGYRIGHGSWCVFSHYIFLVSTRVANEVLKVFLNWWRFAYLLAVHNHVFPSLLSIYLSIYLFIYLSIYPSIYPICFPCLVCVVNTFFNNNSLRQSNTCMFREYFVRYTPGITL